MLSMAGGCAAKDWKPLDPSALKIRPARTIGVVGTKPATFYARTAAKAVFGLVGLALMAGEGQKIIAENHVHDPALEIGDRLSVALSTKHSLVQQTPRPLSVTHQASHEQVRWDTDLVLEVTTKTWSLFYFPTDWTHYRVWYEASMELRDARDQRLLASGDCLAPRPEDSKGAPTYDEMVDRHAAMLKQKLNEAAAFCAQKYSRELFGVRLPDDTTPPVGPPADPRVVHASCHLEETAAWKQADATEKQRMLHECWDRRAREVKAAQPPPSEGTQPQTPAGAPGAADQPAP
jgi:hypothetical protein